MHAPVRRLTDCGCGGAADQLDVRQAKQRYQLLMLQTYLQEALKLCNVRVVVVAAVERGEQTR